MGTRRGHKSRVKKVNGNEFRYGLKSICLILELLRFFFKPL